MSEHFRNTEEYWNRRFGQDWSARGGPGQTRFFAEVAIRAMPEWLTLEIRDEKLGVLDWGCAEGDATDALAAALGTDVVGVDVSERAIAVARQRFPARRFVRADVEQLEKCDVLFTSNTLEHFDHPMDVLSRLLERTRRYAVVLVPFREAKRIDEHLSTFDFNGFPLRLRPFWLVAFQVIDAAELPGTRWPGEQILVVYANEQTVAIEGHRLSSLAAPLLGAFEGVRRQLSEARADLAQARDALATANGELGQLRGQLESARGDLAGTRAELTAARSRAEALAAAVARLRDGLQQIRFSPIQKAVTLGRSLTSHTPATLATVVRWARGAYRPLGIGLAGALSASDRLWELEDQARAALEAGGVPVREPDQPVTAGPAPSNDGAEAAAREALAVVDEVHARGGDRPVVALQVDAFDKGGLEEVVLSLAHELSRTGGWTPVILAAGPVGYLGRCARTRGIDVIALHGSVPLLRTVLQRLAVRIANHHYSTFGVEEYVAERVPIVYTVHNAYIWSDAEWVRQRSKVYRRMSAFVAVSGPVREFFTSRFGVDPGLVKTIANGLDIEDAARPEPLARSDLGLAPDDVVFVNVAAFNWFKFHLLMIAALERVVRRAPRAKLVLVGAVQDERCAAAVRASIARKGLEAHVRILEYVPKPRVLGLLKASDCFLLPSLVEGSSIAALEAMHAGLPLILSDVGSARDLIRNGDIGQIVKNPFPDLGALDMDVVRREYMDESHLANLDDLVEAMVALCEDPESWRRRGTAGHERVVREYTSAKMAEAYAACYRDVADRAVRAR